MQTQLSEQFGATAAGSEAERIIRSCVHCGFCTATCPTYQLLGDELDGPRGRIYLIKQMLEGNEVSRKTQGHLDRCLTCRACETTCPSGVEYGRLVDIGRAETERRVVRPLSQRLARRLLMAVIPYKTRFGLLLRIGQAVRPLLPMKLRRAIPIATAPPIWPAVRHSRRMVALGGCVQPALAPNIDAALARVLDGIGISLLQTPDSGCCGAVSHHLSAEARTLAFARRNIDAWWPAIEAGAEAIIVTASGCGVVVKEYGYLLRDDPDYAAKAARVAELARDPVEVLLAEREAVVARFRLAQPVAVAFHSPCTLQHGQKLPGRVESLLRECGYQLTEVADAHLCCGSAGTYSLTQPTLSRQLRSNKLAALEAGKPVIIATANIGCLSHLQGGTDTPITHWIEMFDRNLNAV